MGQASDEGWSHSSKVHQMQPLLLGAFEEVQSLRQRIRVVFGVSFTAATLAPNGMDGNDGSLSR